MKIARLIVVIGALLSLQAVVAGGAPASTVGECQLQLETLRAETVAAETSFTNPKDFNLSLIKLDEAAAN